MPRRQSLPAQPPASLLRQPDHAGLPAPNDPVYLALCMEEFTAYTAWLAFGVTNTVESRQQLKELRHIYEEKRTVRSAYQSSAV